MEALVKTQSRPVGGSQVSQASPDGPYVVDFYCPASKLVIEVDGPAHAETLAQDAVRDDWLKSHGYRVLRFSADLAYRKTDEIVDALLREIGRGQPLPPSGNSP